MRSVIVDHYVTIPLPAVLSCISGTGGLQLSQSLTGEGKSEGWMSVQAAVTAVTRCDTMGDLSKTCIQFSGDVDTVAAIALAAGSCSTEIALFLQPIGLMS